MEPGDDADPQAPSAGSGAPGGGAVPGRDQGQDANPGRDREPAGHPPGDPPGPAAAGTGPAGEPGRSPWPPRLLRSTRQAAAEAGRGVRDRLGQYQQSRNATGYEGAAGAGRASSPESAADALTGTAGPGGDERPDPPIGYTVPVAVKEAAAWSWRILLVAALGYAVVHVLSLVPIVTIPLITSLLLAAVLTPVRRWLHQRCRIPHTLSSFIALLLGVSVIGVIFSFVADQMRSNAPSLIAGFSSAVGEISAWLRDGPWQLDDAQVAAYAAEITGYLSRNQDSLLSGALATLSTLTEVLAGFLLLLFTTFFMLRDGEVIWAWVLSLLPRRSRRRLDQVGRAGWHTVGGFMRGQTVIALLHATTIFVVLWVLHVPMAVALAVLIFVGSYIPILGMTVSGTVCVIVSLIEHGPGAALVVGITILVLVQLEAHLLQPLIMAHHVEVHPLGVAVAVLAGTSLGGIAGALFAVPLVAFLNATFRAAGEYLPGDTG